MKRLLASYVFIVTALFAAWQASAQLVGDGVFKPPGAPIINPASIFGLFGNGGSLISWYSADQQVFTDIIGTPATNGQTVYQWADITTRHNLYQQQATNRPTFGTASFNGKPGITFSSASSNFMNNAIFSSPFTEWNGLSASSFWFVFNYTNAGQAFARLWSTGDGGQAGVNDSSQTNTPGVSQRNNLLNQFQSFGSGAGVNINVSASTNVRFGTVYTPAAAYGYINGAIVASGGGTTTTYNNSLCFGISQGFRGCTANQLGNATVDGVFAEIVITNNNTTPAQAAQLDRYFKNHWGL